MKKKIFNYLVTTLFFGIFSVSFGQLSFSEETGKISELLFFYSDNCNKCIEIKTVLPVIEKNFKDKLKIVYLDIADIENYKLLIALKRDYDIDEKAVFPVLFLEGHFLDGRTEFGGIDAVNIFIKKSLGSPFNKKSKGEVDLIKYFKTFKFLTVSGAGFADGINPCAITVIIFFMSFLTFQGYGKKELIGAGLSFIFAVFLAYILIGLGLFAFLYKLKGFIVISKIINISVGLFSIILGILCIYDFFNYKKTGSTEGLIMQLPRIIKNKIHSIIGRHYRISGDRADSKPHIFKLIISALFVGFLVSLLEAVCTGQMYLPTIVFVLKTTSLKVSALLYLLLYNIMFIVPLLIIFLFAFLGVTSERFAVILKRYILHIKILMAIVFLALGIFLVFSQVNFGLKNAYAGGINIKEGLEKDPKPQEKDPYFWDFGKAKEGGHFETHLYSEKQIRKNPYNKPNKLFMRLYNTKNRK